MCASGGCPILPGIIGKGGILRIGNSNLSPRRPSRALPVRAASNERGNPERSALCASRWF